MIWASKFLIILLLFVGGCEEYEMHRTEGDDYVLELGKRRFVDDNPPLVTGTIDPAEFSNAVQEELCYIVETVTGDPAACDQTAEDDRDAEWHQVYDAIFEGGHMTSAGIDEISLSKIGNGEKNIINSDASEQTIWNKSGFSVNDLDNTFGMSNVAAGNVYNGASHPSSDKSVRYNRMILDMTGEITSWSQTGYIWETNLLSPAVDTGIKNGYQIYGASATYTINGTPASLRSSPAHLYLFDNGTTWELIGVVITGSSDPTQDPDDNVKLQIDFDGRAL